MTFTILITILPCNHIILNYTTSIGKTGQIITSRDDIIREIAELNIHDKVLSNLISFIKEQRASGRTWAQVKTDVETKVFTI